MRLNRVEIKNYRSLCRTTTCLELSAGGNYFAGPNNAGKSNIIRAIELALRPEQRGYVPERDQPKMMNWCHVTIMLEFEFTQGSKSVYKTLRKYLRDYEISAGATSGNTYAENGKVKFHVQYQQKIDSRQEKFLASGQGARRGDAEKLKRALAQFHKCVRFVSIESGESLQSLLKRGFLEVLGPVLEEQAAQGVQLARDARRDYIHSIQKNVFHAIQEHVADEIAAFIPDVMSVQLFPQVGTLEEAIAGAAFDVTDAVTTPLSEKGTGVRGALILTLMSFIARESKRAVIFAIEEPEAFLHPASHRLLGEALESFTNRSNVSVLVTTHSPFMFTSSSDGAKVFSVQKAEDGQTTVSDQGGREAAVDDARGLLIGSSTICKSLAAIESVPTGTQLILVVEGYTDKRYFELAVQKAALPELMEGVHIVACDGADDAAVTAVALRNVWSSAGVKISAVFDSDRHGKEAQSRLNRSPFNFQNKKGTWLYSEQIPPAGADVEAEDLFPQALMERFFQSTTTAYMAEKVQRPQAQGTFHYGINQPGKGAFLGWLETKSQKSDWDDWVQFLQKIRQKHGLL